MDNLVGQRRLLREAGRLGGLEGQEINGQPASLLHRARRQERGRSQVFVQQPQQPGDHLPDLPVQDDPSRDGQAREGRYAPRPEPSSSPLNSRVAKGVATQRTTYIWCFEALLTEYSSRKAAELN
jgi:hypothetical protein